MDSFISKIKKRTCRKKEFRCYLSIHFLWPHWKPGRKAVPAEICFRPQADNCNIKTQHQDKGVQGRTIKSGQANPLEPTYGSQEKEPRVNSFYCTTQARQLSKILVHIYLFPLTKVLKITTDRLFLLSPNFYGPYHLIIDTAMEYLQLTFPLVPLPTLPSCSACCVSFPVMVWVHRKPYLQDEETTVVLTTTKAHTRWLHILEGARSSLMEDQGNR